MTRFRLWAKLWVKLSRDNLCKLLKTNGGRYRIRTYDFHRVRMALYR